VRPSHLSTFPLFGYTIVKKGTHPFSPGGPKSLKIKTEPYPGLKTDCILPIFPWIQRVVT